MLCHIFVKKSLMRFSWFFNGTFHKFVENAKNHEHLNGKSQSGNDSKNGLIFKSIFNKYVVKDLFLLKNLEIWRPYDFYYFLRQNTNQFSILETIILKINSYLKDVICVKHCVRLISTINKRFRANSGNFKVRKISFLEFSPR